MYRSMQECMAEPLSVLRSKYKGSKKLTGLTEEAEKFEICTTLVMHVVDMYDRSGKVNPLVQDELIKSEKKCKKSCKV